MTTVTLIGPGRLGGALAIALSRSKYRVDRLVYHEREPSPQVLAQFDPSPELARFSEIDVLGSDVVLVAVPDTELVEIAEMAATKSATLSVLLHTSGALSSEVFASAASGSVATGSMHPLVSVSDPILGSASFNGAYFCVEGTDAAAAAAREMAEALGGRPFSIETRFKPLYHASAVLASGHLVALVSTAIRALASCGLTAERAQEILLPLIASSVTNLSRQQPASALTGPFARTDADAIGRHLRAFDLSGLGEEKRIYLELGLEALRLAASAGGDEERIDRILEMIKLANPPRK